MGDRFRDGMSVLDYGCGVGRYAHFLRQRLDRFEYVGLEKPGAENRHGENSVAVARKIFRRDPRCGFDLIGSDTETRALSRADVAVLGSIFTHVDFGEVQRILEKLQPVADRGVVVFSIFLDDHERLEGPGAYGFPDCYGRVWFTRDQLEALCHANGWKLEESESFLAQDVNVHRIFALTTEALAPST